MTSAHDVEGELRAINERLVLSSLRAHESSEASDRERARLHALVSALHEGVVIIDGAGDLVMLNEAARRMMGLQAGAEVLLESVTGLDVRRLDMTYLPASEHPLARALGGSTFADAEMLLVRADGEVRRVMTSCTKTVDAGGALTLAIVVFRDTTERHRMEADLAQTVRLAAIGTLAAGVAHEINNPLTYVTTNVDLVLDELRARTLRSPSTDLAALEAMLVDAQLGAERIRKIVVNLRTFSRTDDERRAVLDVRPILDSCLELAVSEIRQRARVVKAYGPVPLVEADDAQLRQVFVNLLVNAAHALPEGDAARHEIRITTSTARDGSAVIEIRDTGAGLADEVVPHVFDPFFTTTHVGKGMGLALSVCRNIVVAMGGEIAVTSQTGRGTTFRVVLPASVRCPAVEPAAALAGSASRRATVLIVDDEPLVAVALQRILRAHEVTVVTGGRAALALLAAGRTFDVILSDLMMPEMSGMDLRDELIRCSPGHVERLVFVTGGAFTEAGHAFLEKVPNARIGKPFDGKSVRAVVDKQIQAQRDRAPGYTTVPAEGK